MSLLVRLRDPADAVAWRTFIDVYAPAVFAFARRYGLQPADAADLTQDVCRNVSTALQSFAYDPDRGRFRGWLFTVVRNQLKMFRRSRVAAPARAIDRRSWPTCPTRPTPSRGTWNAAAGCSPGRASEVKPTVAPATWQAFWRTGRGRAQRRDGGERDGTEPRRPCTWRRAGCWPSCGRRWRRWRRSSDWRARSASA